MDFPITLKPAVGLVPYERNARTHSKEQIEQIKQLIRLVGFTNPILEDAQGIIAGHGRQMAALEMYAAGEVIHGPGKRFELPPGMVPVIDASGMSDAERRAYILADNQVALNAGWDDRLVGLELQTLKGLEFDLATIGFDDRSLVSFMATTKPEADPEEVPEPPAIPTSRPGDLWLLGDHRIICGDCTNEQDVDRVSINKIADVCLSDPPYGLGDTASDKNNYDTHIDTRDALIELIAKFMPIADVRAKVIVLTPGNANQRLYPAPTWTMAWFTPAGAGSGPWGFCCWQPILCFGKDPKLSKRKGRAPDAIVHTEAGEKNGHPCAKPINFWVWLMERVSERDEVIYDPFMGSGTTIIAAEMTGRRAFGCELSPAYVDVIVRRWQDFTGKAATLEGDGRTFATIAEHRANG